MTDCCDRKAHTGSIVFSAIFRRTCRSMLYLVFLLLPTVALAEERITFAFTKTVFAKVDRNDAISALKVWASTILEENGITTPLTIEMYNSIDDLLPKLEGDGIHGITISTEEVLKIPWSAEHVFLGIINDRPDHQYVILVNKKGPQSLEELESGRVLLYDGAYMNLAPIWFSGLLAKERNFSREDIKKFALKKDEDVSNTIYKVFFRQTDAAIVTADAYRLAVELNPQLGRELQVLHISEPLITTFFVLRPNWQGMTAEAVDNALANIHTNIRGKQVLTVFKSSRMERCPYTVLEPTLEFLKQHREFF